MQKLCLLVSFGIFAISSFGQKPDFAAPNVDGKVAKLSYLRGKVMVLALWFINCPNFVSEINELNPLVEEYKDNKDVVFIAPAESKTKDLVSSRKKSVQISSYSKCQSADTH